MSVLMLSLYLLTANCFGAADSDVLKDSDPFSVCEKALRDPSLSQETKTEIFEQHYDPSFLNRGSLLAFNFKGAPQVLPLTFAGMVAAIGSSRMIYRMIEKGLDPNGGEMIPRREYESTYRINRSSEWTGLHGSSSALLAPTLLENAVYAGNLSTVVALLQNGTNPFPVNFYSFVSDHPGITPLEIAQVRRDMALTDNDTAKVDCYDSIIIMLAFAQKAWLAKSSRSPQLKSRSLQFGCEIL